MSNGWQYALGRSSDMEIIDYLSNAKSRTIKTDLSRSGSCSCNIRLDDDAFTYVKPWSTCLIALLDGEIFWSGPIKNRTVDGAANTLTINAVSWFERLVKLLIQQLQVTYTAVDAGGIVSELLRLARNQDPYLPITMGTAEQTQLRTITYMRDQSIGQAVSELSSIEAGFDWEIDPATRQINIYSRLGIDKPDCKWTFIDDGKSQNSNLSNATESEDGDTLANDIKPRGKFSSGYAASALSQATYQGVHQIAPSLSDVVDQNILDAYANAELVYLANPRVTYGMTPKSSNHPGAMQFGKHFSIGDTGRLEARKGNWIVDNQPVRVFGITLAISDKDGSTQITDLQTTAD